MDNVPPTGNNVGDGLHVVGRDDELKPDTYRHGDSGWSGNRDGDSNHHWSGDWRHDHRYDWQNHRKHHRSLFRLGRYYDPYGWGYRRFSIGFDLWPSYYGSSFWLNDPWMYRLPPAYGPYRWVRYYNDALLVNIYTGQVVDVIYSFFW
ncbi:RcnB family protein [Sphingomonas sp. G124]|uniref:RcnB family protein n=1 Tax=Sphingomonas cremea TaxID=2904799 RepID=A0A9X1TYL0_9SPHN|nr:RcnB family protein [Sphingomonas cremea]MCF2515243.1 RcnB family protein [Sphingomonas cremea]